MATTWNDLVSQSDIFSELPSYKNGELQDKVSVSVKKPVKDGKFGLSAAKVGNATESKFTASQTFGSYWNTVASLKVQNKPATEFSLKFTDKLLPLEGASLTLKAAGSKTEESLSASVNYSCCSDLDLTVGGTINNPLRLYGFASEETLATKAAKVDFNVLYNVKDDYFVGTKGNIYVPSEDDKKTLFDASFVIAQRNANFEGGMYDKYERTKEKNGEVKSQLKCGAWASVQKGDLLLRAHMDKVINSNKQYKGFSFTSGFVKTNEDGSKLIGQVQIVPDTTVSVGYQKQFGKAKLSFGFARVLAFGKDSSKLKSSAFNFGLDLTH